MNAFVKLYLVVLGLFLTTACFGDDQEYFSIPESSSLVVKNGNGMPYVAFSGKLSIESKYKVTCENKCPKVALYPYESSKINMPYLIRRGQDQMITKIVVKNHREAALDLIGEGGVSKLENQHDMQFEGEIEVSIDKFLATYECDKPLYMAKYISTNKVISAAIMSAKTNEYGC